MANLTEEEKDALRAIECIGSTRSDVTKALMLMGFIYTLMAILYMRG